MMLFRQKSFDASLSKEVQTIDKEERRRRRLSKPLTNKSNTNLQVLAQQQNMNRSRTTIASDDSISPIGSPLACDEPRELIKSRIFDSESESKPSTPLNGDTKPTKGVALLVSRFESTHSEISLSPPQVSSAKSNRPLSAIFANRRFSNNQNKSQLSLTARQRGDDSGSSIASISPAVSSEGIVEVPDVPLRRRASFAPGVASRVPKVRSYQETPKELIADKDRAYYYDRSRPETSPLSQLEALGMSQETPQIIRSGTPSDLDVPHLGGLTLGSLHVVNGRASPAPSELSRHFTPRPTTQLTRDVSSEYADSVYDVFVPSDALDTPEVPRIAICDGNFESLHTKDPQTTPEPKPVSKTTTWSSLPGQPDMIARGFSIKRKPVGSSDNAIIIAETYMAEINESPYSNRSPVSPTGSVLRTTTKPSEVEDQLFEDEIVGGSESSRTDRADSSSTWYTPSDAAASDHDEAFQSCLELQQLNPPQYLRPPVTDRKSENSDSGYSSNTSEQQFMKTHQATSPECEIVAEVQMPVEQDNDEVSERKSRKNFDPNPFRPSILKQKTAPELPTFANLQPSTMPSVTRASTPSPVKSPKPKKLQKSRPVSRVRAPPTPIIVQGAQSTDDLTIPSPSAQQIANLQIRTQQIPELERTFRSMHHSRKDSRSSLSTGIPFDIEMRFPSPTRSPERSPERSPRSDKDERTRARSSSRKRDSFIARMKIERRQSLQRRSSGISESDVKATIHDFGTVASSLGSSPYDIARNDLPPRPATCVPSQSKNASFNITPMAQVTPVIPKTRPMMGDRTASEFARLKSKSIHERDNQNGYDRKPTFNDRGGIPGKNLRQWSIARDAPPLPPLPIHRHIPEQPCWNEQQDWVTPPRSDVHHYWNEYPPLEQLDSDQDPPPPPPSHSPRPYFVESTEYIEEPSRPPPPPPSHSPKPVVIEPNPIVEDIWAVQAEAWKNRRKSLGEILYKSNALTFSQGLANGYEEQAIIDDDDEQLYPSIPPRRPYSIAVPDTGYSAHPKYTFPEEDDNNNEYYEPIQRALPRQPSGQQGSRPQSRVSQANSFASSLAEELHPEHLERPQPPPQFGRYSGGLNYGYEHGVGFGGSAGVRTASGQMSNLRKSVPLSTNYGIDLTDVPIIAGLRRIM